GIIAAAGALQFDHVRAQVAQQLAAERAGQDARRVQHANIVQRTMRIGSHTLASNSTATSPASPRGEGTSHGNGAARRAGPGFKWGCPAAVAAGAGAGGGWLEQRGGRAWPRRRV